MGFIYKPIPPNILLKMPPAVREQAYRQERAFLEGIRVRQGATLRMAPLLVISAMIIGALIAYLGN